MGLLLLAGAALLAAAAPSKSTAEPPTVPAARTRLRTGGFDYDVNTARRATEARWLARHHDLIVGMQPHGAGRAFDGVDVRTLRAIRAANPRAEVYAYVPFQTVMPWMRAFMEDWARDAGRDPEDLYCHYAVDTDVKLRDQSVLRVPGFPDGAARERAAARVPSTWWKGAHPNICPVSPLFREAFAALVERAVDAPGRPLEGVFLDSFAGTLDKPWDLQLQNVAELRAAGARSADEARAEVADALASLVRDVGRALEKRFSRPIVVMPNAGDVDDVYHWHRGLFAERFGPGYDAMGVEFLITPGHARTARIPRLKEVYDDLAHPTRPVRMFLTSHTSVDGDAPAGLERLMLATHYLLQHDNATFGFHRGGAGWYGARRGRFANSHWHPHLELDLGRPVARAAPDAWSRHGTDRFFVLEETPQHTVLARAFERGLVVAKFGVEAGLARIGTHRAPVALGGTYRMLLENNVPGPPVTSIELGWGEGAILVRP